MAEIEGQRRALVINEILRIALRHANLLHREAFKEVVDVIARATPVAQVALSVPDGPQHNRVYAISPGPGEAILPFGARFPMEADIQRVVYEGAEPYFCHDMSTAGDRARQAAQAGFRSYVMFPARAGGVVRGGLIVSFRELSSAAEAPASLLQEIADILGESLDRAVRTARERRLAMILETSGDAMLAWDRSGEVTDANVAAASMTGQPRDALIGRSISSLLMAQADQGVGTPPPSQGIRMDLARSPSANGEPRRLPVAATITAVDDDPLVAAHALLRDLSNVVTAERQAALRLARIRELEEQHRTLLDNAPLIIFRLNPQATKLVYLNRYAERLLGVPRGEALVSQGFLRNAHADPEGVAAFDSAVARAKSGAESLPYEARLRRRQGDEIMARGTVYPLLSERGEVDAIEGVLADVSVEHDARTRLVQTDRLSTLGMLAAGVAHEINNPAAFMRLGLDLLEKLLAGRGVAMDAGSRRSVSDLVKELRDALKRIVDITQDLRLFAHPPPAPPGRAAIIDVNRTMESALTLTRGQIIERAEIIRDLEEVPPVLMRDGRLGQVLVNLLVNASQSIPQEYPSSHAILVKTRSDGNTVEIEVSDTGVGITPENLARIWTPFFTTKSSDVGTGLGLSISREIIEHASGSIRCESPVPGSDPPRGSRFVISLPAAGAQLDSSAQGSMPPSARTASMRASVLVVEDETGLARVLADELGAVHEVTVVDSAPAALSMLSHRSFDVVLCDLRMPGMTGDVLYTKVAETNPAQAEVFIFMTGVGFGGEIERFLAMSGRPLLEKPFSTEAALLAVSRVISRKTLN